MSEIPENSKVSIYSKNEKKARELIQKFSMKPMPGITRVTFRKKNNQIFAIDNPDVYKTQGGNYVVFGEPKVDDFTRRLARAQQQAASAAKDPQSIQADMAAAAAAPAAPAAPAAAPEEDEAGQVDESGLDGQDIELVMQQANVSRNKAVKALREHNSDIVNAIMSLSK